MSQREGGTCTKLNSFVSSLTNKVYLCPNFIVAIGIPRFARNFGKSCARISEKSIPIIRLCSIRVLLHAQASHALCAQLSCILLTITHTTYPSCCPLLEVGCGFCL